MMTRDDVTITHHMPDGMLTLSAMHDGYYVKRRYLDYTRDEAMALFLAEFGPDNSNCPNRLGWTVDYWHECDTCR